jgi:hypothetical protein
MVQHLGVNIQLVVYVKLLFVKHSEVLSMCDSSRPVLIAEMSSLQVTGVTTDRDLAKLDSELQCPR